MTVNLQRRKAVMARSIQLGHCVCNPKNPCPCDVFIKYNTCPCAGEKLPVREGAVPLTRHVRKAGCASKIGQADLLRVLGQLPPVEDPKVLVGAAAGDDAGVYELDGGQRLVQTVDVFTPCVDDAYLFGQIAAANSLSDVYAMGGRPLTALSIVGFPIDELDDALLERMLRGGLDKLNEAGCSLIGGHSINDEEIKCGFAVTGVIDGGRPVTRAGAQAGDALVLTKPLGTGMVCFAAQLGRATPAALEQVGASMAALNKDAAELMVALEAHACTDVTGFGLAGHLLEMARDGGVSVEVDLARLPVFAAATACLERDIFSGAIERNQEYSMAWVRADEAAERALPILYDPQTSGGLLIALPEDRAEKLVAALHERGETTASIVGRVIEKDVARDSEIIVRDTELKNIIGNREFEMVTEKEPPAEQPAAEQPAKACCASAPAAQEACCANQPAAEAACCANPPAAAQPTEAACCAEASAPTATAAAPSDADDVLDQFRAFMQAANAPGLIDRRSKKLMAIALSVALRCKPCVLNHIRSGREMGLSWEEIDEAANLAISFAGCTGMLFYSELRRELETG